VCGWSKIQTNFDLVCFFLLFCFFSDRVRCFVVRRALRTRCPILARSLLSRGRSVALFVTGTFARVGLMRVRAGRFLCLPDVRFLLLPLCVLFATVNAGPGAVALCYTACNTGCMTCYAAAGVTFGTTPVGWWAALWGAPAAVAACGAIQGSCMAACTALVVAPTP
jgi:hypothetical protein